MGKVRIILRVLIALVFIFSATAKLLVIDEFEVYLYQLGMVGFDWSAWIARLVISAEFIVSLGFLTKWFFPVICRITFLTILIFSTFLLYQIFFGTSSNCFCFGELVSMSPLQSLFKNLILIALMLPLRNEASYHFNYSGIVFLIGSIAALTIPVIISPPDNLLPGRITQAEVDQSALDQVVAEKKLPMEILQGRKIIGFYSTSCRFCQLSSTRLSAAFKYHQLDPNLMHIVFLDRSEARVLEFIEQTDALFTSRSFLSSADFLHITKGRMPLIMLLEDGKLETGWNYRQIDEARLVEFLSASN